MNEDDGIESRGVKLSRRKKQRVEREKFEKLQLKEGIKPR
jgi:hypothetical protein